MAASDSRYPCEPDMIDKLEEPACALDVTVHALRIASAISSNASEPSEVIANAESVLVWLSLADEDPADLRRRMVAAYQQLDNQRGAGCEAGLFLKRAHELYAFLCRADTIPPPAGDVAGEREDVDA